jgi:hypothetical protein
MRPDDLRGTARDSYDTWRRLGLSESAAMNALVEDGVVQLSQHDRLVKNFRETFGLSERAAEIAAAGRDGPPVRPVSEVAVRSSAGHQPGGRPANGRQNRATCGQPVPPRRLGGEGPAGGGICGV